MQDEIPLPAPAFPLCEEGDLASEPWPDSCWWYGTDPELCRDRFPNIHTGMLCDVCKTEVLARVVRLSPRRGAAGGGRR